MLNANQYIIRKVHMLLIMLIGLAGFATPMSAVGVEISIPSGLQEIGQALNLKSRISALPPGTETQLRSTCLKARILPLETSASYSLEWQSSGVAVEFLPDAVNSGQLQFKSLAPINHALVELELVSSCPLVVFETKWALILDPPALPHAATPPGANLANRGSSPVDKSFDMEQSRMLAMTRQRQVPPGPGALAAWAEPAIQKPAQEKTSFISKGADHQAASTTVTPPANALRVAALGGNALDGGLNQGHTGNAVVDAMTDPLHASLQQSGEGWWFQSYVLPLGLAVLVLSIAVLGQYWSSKRRPESTGSQYPGSEEMDESGGGFEFEAGKAEPVLRHSPERIMQGGTASGMRAGDSPRVLETLLGNACTQPEDVSDFSSTAFFKNQVEGERRTSLAESLEQMNRADLRKWSLPAAYLS
ncbi:MAG TPA: hypothetical protein VFV28_02950, partial [Limnobacter sp.]|nr:hypothetical protein [Limnobacter sp.]